MLIIDKAKLGVTMCYMVLNAVVAAYNTSIKYQCEVQFQLVHFVSSFLIMHMGEQETKTQVFGFLSPAWFSISPGCCGHLVSESVSSRERRDRGILKEETLNPHIHIKDMKGIQLAVMTKFLNVMLSSHFGTLFHAQ